MRDRDTITGSSISWFTVAICLLGCVYYYLFFFNRAFVELEIDVEHKTHFKIYWSAGDQPFSEKRRAVVAVQPGNHAYSFYFTNLGKVDTLRVDPFQFS